MDSIINHCCSICLGLFYNPVTTKCSHTYCKMCLEELVEYEQKVVCPLCRKEIKNIANLVVDKQKEQYLAQQFPTEFAKRLEEAKRQEQLKANSVFLIIEYGNSHEYEQNPLQSQSNPSKQNQHRWCCFVKLSNLEGKESDYIERVEFKLHETFKQPLVITNKAPFQVSRLGWGTFQIPIKIYWKNWLQIQQPTELNWNLQFSQPEKKSIFKLKISQDILKNRPVNK
ncbi:YEATS family protein (macronuclear) [Tetrahymena thermophila SB210]|uniref:YEATS family protein n=1 Tax=Tetrahymena thermophila (strain SB210) TaxID=312017 RepID=Q245M7_TETTS|nr:YEATS family protein [Tetrahymena thermophila SB210]EAS03606.2 YEATS family protein [Tetrahymena thermophila SB210]|eukprot:XP_001023851.2 YEATS family protein [Tetrahymena thermophila SB210]